MTNSKSDERIAKNDGRNVRGDRSQADDVRTNDTGTAFNEDEWTQMLRNEFQQEALPDAPRKPGWHRCWLSITSSWDPIHKRMKLGYTPVSAADVAGSGIGSELVKEGQFAGAVSCNEMVLFEIPEFKYQAYMRYMHDQAPREEEGNIKGKATKPSDVENEDSSGKKLFGIDEEDSGFREFGRQGRVAEFQ